MTKEIFASERKFQVWSYVVSHKQLLFRSPKDSQFDSRVDILFKGVDSMCARTSMNGISVSTVDPASVDVFCYRAFPDKTLKLFHIDSEGVSGYISAVDCISFEDDKEYYDESALVSSERL